MVQASSTPVFSRRTLFVVATVFGVSSTVQAVFLAKAADAPKGWGGWLDLGLLNLAYWYVPALLAPGVMNLARRHSLDRTPVWRQVALHGGGLLAYGAAHTFAMAAVRVTLAYSVWHRPMMMDGFWSRTTTEYVRQFDWLLMTYLFLVGLAHALDYRGQSERHALASSRLETRLVEARLQSLQRQLHPHFLFNTLNTISALVRTNAVAADRMIEQLGSLLRLTLRAGDRPVVPLEAELEALGVYLEIEQTRLGARLQVQQCVDPDTLDAEVPSLLLQPLVENAIRHGVAPHSRQGWVRVEASRRGDRLHVAVCDSGEGVDEGSLSKPGSGVGLANTRARLQHLYPGDHRLSLGAADGGFMVTIDLPYRLAGDARPGRQPGAA